MSGYVGFKKKKSKIWTTLSIVAALHLCLAGGLVWLASTAVGQEFLTYYKINIRNVKEPEPPKPKAPEPEPPKPEPPKPEEAPLPAPEPEAAPPPPVEQVESAPPPAPSEAAPQGVQLPSMGNPFAGGQGKKYSGYIDLVTTEIQRLYHQPSDLSNSITLSVMFQLRIDEEGKLLGYQLLGSSGNDKFDQSALQAISKLKQLRPPPTGMSRTIIVKFIPPP
jgi:protein TonB